MFSEKIVKKQGEIVRVKNGINLDVVVRACNPCTWVTETGGS
jgi:hypothetical protein